MKPEEYILEAAKNKAQASQMLDDEIKKVNGGFEDLAKKAAPEDSAKVMKTIAQAQAILAKVRAGGDIHNLVAELQKLKL